MEKTCLQIAKFFGLSTSVIIPMLCRPEFDKYKHGTKYKINIDFIDSMYNFFEMKKLSKVTTRDKFQKAQKKLYYWKRRLTAQKTGV